MIEHSLHAKGEGLHKGKIAEFHWASTTIRVIVLMGEGRTLERPSIYEWPERRAFVSSHDINAKRLVGGIKGAMGWRASLLQ